MWAWAEQEAKHQLQSRSRRIYARGPRPERDCSCTELGGREWVAPQMSFLAKPMRIIGIKMQLDFQSYAIGETDGMNNIADIVVTLIEEATHSFTRLLM